MKLFKFFILFFLFNFNLVAIEINLKQATLNNGQTALITIKDSQGLTNVKLTFNKLNINFLKNPHIENSLYALIPISYYTEKKKYKIIISYIKNKNKVFKGLYLEVKEGAYKSEVIKVLSSKVSLNKKDKKRTKKERISAYKIYNHKSKKLLWKDDFIIPIKTKVTSSFGTKRVYNKQLKSYHTGVDFKAKIGTKIIASNSGIVKISKLRFYAGNSIIIDHGHGVYTQYYHLSKLLKKVGDRVKKGDTIGLSGKTGRVTGPHLHFSAKVTGITVEPIQLLKVLNSLRD